MRGNRRSNGSRKINSILLLDNEHTNIADLEMLLREAAASDFAEGEGVRYVSSPDEAVRVMSETKLRCGGYSAIVVDDHMDTEESQKIATIDGQDFIRILFGALGYCISRDAEDIQMGSFQRFDRFSQVADEVIGKTCMRRMGHHRAVLDFMERNFHSSPRKYDEFVQYYTGRGAEVPFILFYCGHPGFIDMNGLGDVEAVRKSEGCEKKALAILRDEGLISERKIQESISNHYRLGGGGEQEQHGYNPMSAPLRRFLHVGKKFRFDEEL